MFKQLLGLVVELMEESTKKDTEFDNKTIQMIEELEELEVKYVKALADAEEYGDLNDTSHFRTVTVNKYKRLIESKERMIQMLKDNK